MIPNIDLRALVNTELAPAVDRLVKRVDANADGCVSASEFTRFLNEVLDRMEQVQQLERPQDRAK